MPPTAAVSIVPVVESRGQLVSAMGTYDDPGEQIHSVRASSSLRPRLLDILREIERAFGDNTGIEICTIAEHIADALHC